MQLDSGYIYVASIYIGMLKKYAARQWLHISHIKFANFWNIEMSNFCWPWSLSHIHIMHSLLFFFFF